MAKYAVGQKVVIVNIPKENPFKTYNGKEAYVVGINVVCDLPGYEGKKYDYKLLISSDGNEMYIKEDCVGANAPFNPKNYDGNKKLTWADMELTWVPKPKFMI